MMELLNMKNGKGNDYQKVAQLVTKSNRMN